MLQGLLFKLARESESERASERDAIAWRDARRANLGDLSHVSMSRVVTIGERVLVARVPGAWDTRKVASVEIQREKRGHNFKV